MNGEIIGKKSKLFGLFDEMAGESERVGEFNRLFKENGFDGFYIPMNIRADDFYFTLNGTKKSQISALNIGLGYRKEAIEQLDRVSDEVEVSGFVDSIIVADEKLYGYITIGKAISNLIQDGSKVAIFGSGSLAKSIVYNLKDRDIEISIVQDRVESALKISEIGDIDPLFSDSSRPLDSSLFTHLIDSTDGAEISINWSGSPSVIAFKGSKIEDRATVSSKKIREEQNLIDFSEWSRVGK